MKRSGDPVPRTWHDKKSKISNPSRSLFWLDVALNPSAPHHQLLLFGKTRDEKSVCLRIEDVPRVVWFLPRRPPKEQDWFSNLHREIQSLMAQYKIKDYKVKKVRKKSCFHPDPVVPRDETDYMEVVYSRRHDALPVHEIQGETFSHIFGTQTSILEQFLLDRRLMGPCWIDMQEVQEEEKTRISWCKIEWSVPHSRCVQVSHPSDGSQVAQSPVPPLKLLGLEVEKQGSRIVSIRVTQGLYTATDESHPAPDKIQTLQGSTEKILLQRLCGILSSWDPDLLIGHDMDSVGKNMALRMQVSGVDPVLRSAWSRVKRSHTESSRLACALGGRLVCDTLVAARKLIRVWDYSLPALLNHEPPEKQTSLTLARKLGVLPLCQALATLSGTRWSKTLQMNPEHCDDIMLLHRFHDRGYLLPEPHDESKRSSFQGGLVLEPKMSMSPPGLVLLLDFNSLYPSIIQEFQIDWTTEGILPQTVRDLIQERQTIKDQLRLWKTQQRDNIEEEKQDIQKTLLDIRQKALKLLANAMYGCLGSPHSRFYCPEMAARVTEHGRTILQQTVQDIESLGYTVIYGDTDSAMVASRVHQVEEAEQIAQEILARVNAKSQILHMELDGLLKCVLLFAKKKYAALKRMGDSWQLELKGMESIRRDWCELAKDMQEQTLRCLLEHDPEEASVRILEYMAQMQSDMQSNRVPLQHYVLTKELKKAPNRYSDPKPDHVQVALSSGVHRAGSLIRYVMTPGHQPRAEKRVSSSTEVDVNWYMEHQILPLLTRLTEWMQKAELPM